MFIPAKKFTWNILQYIQMKTKQSTVQMFSLKHNKMGGIWIYTAIIIVPYACQFSGGNLKSKVGFSISCFVFTVLKGTVAWDGF